MSGSSTDKIKVKSKPQTLVFDRFLTITNPDLLKKKIKIGETGKPNLETRRRVEQFLIENKDEIPNNFKIIINNNGIRSIAEIDSVKKIMQINGKEIKSRMLEGVLKHEIEHEWFYQHMNSGDPKLKEYIKEVQKVKPFSINTEVYYEFVQGRKPNVSDVDDIKYGKTPIEYADEFHSETAEYLEYKKLGKEPYFLSDEDAVKEAIKLYNKLHSKN